MQPLPDRSLGVPFGGQCSLGFYRLAKWLPKSQREKDLLPSFGNNRSACDSAWPRESELDGIFGNHRSRKIRHSGAPYRVRSATSVSNTTRSISRPSRSARRLVRRERPVFTRSAESWALPGKPKGFDGGEVERYFREGKIKEVAAPTARPM